MLFSTRIGKLLASSNIGDSRNISVEVLLRAYPEQGLWQDLARLFAGRVLEITIQVLAWHIQSAEEILTIIQEISVEAVGSQQTEAIVSTLSSYLLATAE